MNERIPGEEGFAFEDDPTKVQGFQPHPQPVQRVVPHEWAKQFPDPHNIVDAHIGDSRHY